jgi:ribonuclease P protein component
MLSQKNRLKKKKDIDDAFRGGRAKSNSFFVVKLKNNYSEDWRFGFVVSRKVSKKAVVRNRIKRRLCEIIKNALKIGVFKKDGKDALIIVRPGVDKKDFKEVEKTLVSLLV